MIAAMDKNRVIGKDNDIPWHLPDDFKYFKRTTLHHHVIMGRKNWESLQQNFQPLPNRPNIVISRKQDYKAAGAQRVHSLAEALESARKAGEEEAFIIGGGQIYRLGLPYADRIYLTEIHKAYGGQVTFPEFNTNVWKEVSREHHPADEKHDSAFDFVIYEKQ